MNYYVNGFRKPAKKFKSDFETRQKRQTIQYPSITFVDYTNEMNAIQNQGLCGGCWSFATTSAIEAQFYRKTGVLLKLSEQQLIDCNRDDVNGNYGCSGGDMVTALTFIRDNNGITLASLYPYLMSDIFTCKFHFLSVAKVKSFVMIATGDEQALRVALIEKGPIAIAVDASLPSFQNYKSGIYYDPSCNKENINHAVLLVGFGTDAITKQDYWLIRNTYGTSWGMNGYMKMARNKNNHCGVADFAVYPIL
jgi:cathepsin L